MDVELDTLRQEKSVWTAGYTCVECPNPTRGVEVCVCTPPEPPEGDYPHGWDRTPILEEGCTCGTPIRWTVRCTPCNTKMKRWVRNRKLESRIRTPLEYLETDKSSQVFVAFLTLTIPNIPESPERGSLPDEVRSLKRRVASFRRRKKFDEKIVGGIDVFENTVRPNGDWNIHHHGIWLMNGYWNQAELQEAWGFRVRIEKVRKDHAVLTYLTSYAAKQPIDGVRCLETFGVSRGAAFTAIEEYARRARTSKPVELVYDEWKPPKMADN